MPKYFALTLGPIVDSLSRARETRELWAASYTFSYIVKTAIEHLESEGFEVVSPYYNAEQNDTGAGLYPERIYAFDPKGGKTILDFKDVVHSAVKAFAVIIYEHLDKKSKVTGALGGSTFIYSWPFEGDRTKYIADIELELFTYLKIYIASKDIGNNDEILGGLNKMLESMETSSTISIARDYSYLADFWFRVNDSPFIKDAFNLYYKHFPSIFSISAEQIWRSYRRCDQFDVDEKVTRFHDEHFAIANKLNEQGPLTMEERAKLRNYLPEMKALIQGWKRDYQATTKYNLPRLRTPHKYYAIVYGDGDGVGKAISSIKDPSQLKEFSRELYNFSKDAVEVISAYGGTPIYLGGDDILFFAPIVSLNSEGSPTHLMQLIEQLDECFNLHVPAFKAINDEGNYSLSYGVSISYFKHPLYEAQQEALTNLINKAKKQKDGRKNCIVTTIRKHSGQNWEFILFRGKQNDLLANNSEQTFYNAWKALADKYTVKSIDTDRFMNSLTHRTEMFDSILTASLNYDWADIGAFFESTFNDQVHKETSFMKDISNFVDLAYRNLKDNPGDAKKLVYSLVRYIDFINKDEKE